MNQKMILANWWFFLQIPQTQYCQGRAHKLKIDHTVCAFSLVDIEFGLQTCIHNQEPIIIIAFSRT